MKFKSIHVTARGDRGDIPGSSGRWTTGCQEDTYFDSIKEASAFVDGVEAACVGLEVQNLEFYVEVLCDLHGSCTVELYGASSRAVGAFLKMFEE